MFSVRLCRNKKPFYWKFKKNWESLVTLQLPSAYRVVISTNEIETTDFCYWLYRSTKKRKKDHIWKSIVSLTKKGILSFKKSITWHWRVQKQWLTALKWLLNFHSQKSTCLLQLRAAHLDEPSLTTLLQPLRSKLALTMWTLASVKGDLDVYLDQKWLQLF